MLGGHGQDAVAGTLWPGCTHIADCWSRRSLVLARPRRGPSIPSEARRQLGCCLHTNARWHGSDPSLRTKAGFWFLVSDFLISLHYVTDFCLVQAKLKLAADPLKVFNVPAPRTVWFILLSAKTVRKHLIYNLPVGTVAKPFGNKHGTHMHRVLKARAPALTMGHARVTQKKTLLGPNPEIPRNKSDPEMEIHRRRRKPSLPTP